MGRNVPGRNIQWDKTFRDETSRDETSTGRNGNGTKHPAPMEASVLGNGTFRTLVTGLFGPKTIFSRCEKKC